jgi:hypothetical protein
MATTTPMSPLNSLHPISLLSTPQASLYAHIHPVLIVSTLYAQFPALIQNPVATLASLLLPLAVAQALYTIICLNPVSKIPTAMAEAATKGSKKPQDVSIATRVSVRSRRKFSRPD